MPALILAIRGRLPALAILALLIAPVLLPALGLVKG